MTSKLNAKLALVTLVAALLVAFSAFTFGSADKASADPIGAPSVSPTSSSTACATATPPPLSSGNCVVSGTQVTIVQLFEVLPSTSTVNAALCVNSGGTVIGTSVAAGPTALHVSSSTVPASSPICPGTAPTGGVTSAPTLTLTNAMTTNILASTADVTAFMADQCAPTAVYCASKAQVGGLATALTVALTFTATISCPAGPGSVTFTAAQDSGAPTIGHVGTLTGATFTTFTPDPTDVTATTIQCVTSLPTSTAFACPLNAICVGKLDQFGNRLSAVFALQVQSGFGWTDVARMQTAACNQTVGGIQPIFAFATPACTILTPGANPCVTTGSCTAPSFPNGVPVGNYRVIEVAQPVAGPNNCTLVNIWRGQLPVQLSGPGGTFVDPSLNQAVNSPTYISPLSPALVNIPDTSDNRTLTFINSCLVAGNASATGSRIVPVIGGSSQGVTNTANIEIAPAPGSDDDARIDIQVRDANNIPVQGALVTIVTDKGRIAVRTDISTTTSVGADVIEPNTANFGTNIAGDTCDYFVGQSVQTGIVTFPYANNSPTIQDGFTNQDGIISACLFVGRFLAEGTTPGPANITAYVANPSSGFAGINLGFGTQSIILTARVTVVGPPASITVSASPTTLNCGEKATITVTAKDAANQNVSDHTRIEAITNAGGVLGGTGSTIGFPGVGIANPAASTVAETFNGVATFFLLTSSSHVGPYEVVVTSGGSTGGVLQNVTTSTIFPTNVLAPITNVVNPGDLAANVQIIGNPLGVNFGAFNPLQFGVTNVQPVQSVYGSAGVFSNPPVSSQVTVACSNPVVAAPAAPITIPVVAAPRTGEGPAIRPPNTGNAGLADASGSSSALWLIAGTITFALAGAVTLKAARR